MPKKVLIALPPGMLEQLDYIAQVEHRTRSDLIREAARRYMEEFRKRHAKTAEPMPEVEPIIPPRRGGPHGPVAVSLMEDAELDKTNSKRVKSLLS